MGSVRVVGLRGREGQDIPSGLKARLKTLGGKKMGRRKMSPVSVRIARFVPDSGY